MSSTPTFLYFDLYFNTAHNVYKRTAWKRNDYENNTIR